MKNRFSFILMIFLVNFAVSASAFRIPDTGQTKCYDDKGNEINPCPKPGEPFYGQSANYSINPMSFTKLDSEGNELPDDAKQWAMVRDNNTELIWEVKTDDGSVHDKYNEYTWEEALKVPEKLNAEKFCGRSDWRLPTWYELQSIVDYGKVKPAIDTKYFPNAVSSFHWSYDNCKNNLGYAWNVDFGNGDVNNYNKASTGGYVRCVSSGQARLFDNLVINKDKTVTDNQTGLVWQQGEPGKMTWKNALDYCENLTLGEKNDWRLPTIKELASIVRPDEYNPAADKKYFPKIESSWYWSSDNIEKYLDSAWYVYFNDGNVGNYNKTYDYGYVRCVSSGQARQFDNSVISAAKTEPAKEPKKIKVQEPVSPKETQPAPPQIIPEGDYHALIIGNNKYKYFPPLKTAIQDAKDVADILEKEYSFKTKVLTDATRTEIVNALNQYRRILKEYDNFLIYYAGHGTFDKSAEKAFWLPVNAEPSNDTEWVIVDTITTNIRRISSEHILIVSDSCYSGTLTRTGEINLKPGAERERYLRKMMQKKSRTLIASGGNEPVKDEGGKGHSIFAQAFLDGLKEMEQGEFLAEELFYQHIKEPVAGKASQVPEYHIIRDSGHDGGDFIFMRRK